MAKKTDDASAWETAGVIDNPDPINTDEDFEEEELEDDEDSDEDDLDEEEDSDEDDSDEDEDSDDEESDDEDSDDEDDSDEDDEEEESLTLNEEEADQVAAAQLADYGVESFAQLRELLDERENLLAQNSELEAENEQLRQQPQEPVFKNARQKSIYEFVMSMGNDPETAIGQYSNLFFMDVEKLDAKSALFEQWYLSDNNDLPRDKAMRLFEKEYAEKYGDSDEDDLAQIRLEKDFKKAKKFLLEKQGEIKNQSSEEEEEEEEAEVNEAIEASIEENIDILDESFDGFDSIIKPVDNNPRNNFTYKLTREQKKKLYDAAASSLKNPAQYNEKGQLLFKFDPDEAKKNLVFAMFGDDFLEKYDQHRNTLEKEGRIRRQADRKPDRKTTVEGKVSTSQEDMWESASVKTIRG